MNRYLVKLEAVTEVDAIDESDAKDQVMKKLESLSYRFPSIKRMEKRNWEYRNGGWQLKGSSKTKSEEP